MSGFSEISLFCIMMAFLTIWVLAAVKHWGK